MSKAGKLLEAFVRPPDPYGTSYSSGYVGRVRVRLKGVEGLGGTPGVTKDLPAISEFLRTKILPAIETKGVYVDSTGTGDGYLTWSLDSESTKNTELINAAKKAFKSVLGVDVVVEPK